MKNTLFAIALAAVGFAAVPAISHAADTSGFFVNGAVGRSDLSSGGFDDSDTGYLGNVGYRWAVAPNVLLGVEGGYAKLGEFSAKNSLSGIKTQLEGWNLGVNGHFNVTDNWYVSGRGGWFRGDVSTKSSFIPGSFDDTKNGWYAGAGFGYDFNTNVSVGLNYDYYRVKQSGFKYDPSLVSVSGEYRF